jgi:hypothetical protein
MIADKTLDYWVFEPHGAFRSKIAGEDWPLGYISKGHDEPIFELRDLTQAFGRKQSVKKLAAKAYLISKAPELLIALDCVLQDCDKNAHPEARKLVYDLCNLTKE